jgi:hypothetical protein
LYSNYRSRIYRLRRQSALACGHLHGFHYNHRHRRYRRWGDRHLNDDSSADPCLRVRPYLCRFEFRLRRHQVLIPMSQCHRCRALEHRESGKFREEKTFFPFLLRELWDLRGRKFFISFQVSEGEKGVVKKSEIGL